MLACFRPRFRYILHYCSHPLISYTISPSQTLSTSSRSSSERGFTQGSISQDAGSNGLQLRLNIMRDPSLGGQLTISSTASSNIDDDPVEKNDESVMQSIGRWGARWYRSGIVAIKATFLPAGYPSSCGESYLDYTLWAGITNAAVTANSVLASTFLLYSVGLGAGAIPTAGAINWVLKDGIGQLGTLAFGKAIAHNFDIHSKSWYFLSMVKLKLATAIEMMTIIFPEYFLAMGSAANSIKGLAFMASGSTRSVFNLTFAKDNNIADITAKATSQWIFSSLIGTAAGATMCGIVGQNAHLATSCYAILTAITLLASYQTVKCIPLATLNSTRLHLLADMFIVGVKEAAAIKARRLRDQARQVAHPSAEEWNYDGEWDGESGDEVIDKDEEVEGAEMTDDAFNMEYDRSFDEEMSHKMPSPVSLSSVDPPFPGVFSDDRIMNPKIAVGTSIQELAQGEPNLLVVLLLTFKFSRYMVVPSNGCIHVILHQSVGPRDICQAYLQACLLRRRIRQDRCKYLQGGEHGMTELRIGLQDTLLAAERLVSPFMATLAECGWRTEKVVVEAVRRRARWSS